MGVELIAEVSSNHGGDLVLAKEFIHACAEHGADWVKFQTTRVKHLNPADPQYAWFAKAELSDDAHYELKAECEKAGTKFLTTVYNVAEVPFLASLGLEAIKIGSGEAHHHELAGAVGCFPRVIIGCGVTPAYASPFRRLRVWKAEFLHAVSRYPCSVIHAHEYRYLRRIAPNEAVAQDITTEARVVGWSDHCVGLDGCRLAIARGASVIEKHVQLPNQARPPKSYEATMAELKELRQFADENPQRFIGRWQYA